MYCRGGQTDQGRWLLAVHCPNDSNLEPALPLSHALDLHEVVDSFCRQHRGGLVDIFTILHWCGMSVCNPVRSKKLPLGQLQFA